MRTLILIFLMTVFAVKTWAGDKPTAGDALKLSMDVSKLDWKKASTNKDLNTYWAKVQGQEVVALKGDGTVDAPLEKVASIILDASRGTEWVNDLVESKVVDPTSDSDFVEYDHMGIPFPFDTLIQDIDFVSRVQLKANRKKQRLTIQYHSTEDEKAPVLKNRTRGVLACEFRLSPMASNDGQTYVEAEVFTDTRGSVPKWLVNFFQEGWPHDTFEGLRRQARKDNIKVLPVIQRLLGGPKPEKTAKG